MKKTLTLKEIADIVGGVVVGDASITVSNVADIERASDGDITFISNPRYARHLLTTKAAAVFVTDDTEPVDGAKLVLIKVKDPYLAFALTLKELSPPLHPKAGISKLAQIDKTAKVGKNVHIGAFVTIESNVVIDDDVTIYPGVYIGRDSQVGKSSVIYSNVSLREDVTIGRNVIVHPNSVIGSDGFGFARDGVKYVKIPQSGGVTIGDDVEIGAGTTIDRATLKGSFTKVRRGTKIDNLVQIAHNVEVGEDTVIVSQAGISGSTKIGARVTIAGQAGVAGHIEVADDSVVTAKAGVTNTIKKAGIYSGYPVVEHRDWLKQQILIKQLDDMKKRLKELLKEEIKD